MVLEGNRRFAALKLLADPRLADDIEHQAAFGRLKKRGRQAPKTLYCAVASNRDEANPWITLRHTGANDGVGVRVWSPEQNARHRRRMKAPIDSGTMRSIAVADELTEAYQADPELVGLIKRVRAEKLTNIGRLFSGATLTRMQLQVRQVSDDGSRTLWAKHTPAQLLSFFRWAFKLLDEQSVDAFKNDALRHELLNGNADVLPDVAHSMPEHKRLADHPYSPGRNEPESDGPDGVFGREDSSGGLADGELSASLSEDEGDGGSEDAGTSDESSGDPAGRRRDQRPERSVYSGVKLTNLSTNIQRLLREAKRLPIDENYATACVLARVILELAVSDPKVLEWSGKKEDDTLSQKIRGCIHKLDPQIGSRKRSRQDLVQANLETNEMGVTYLHQFMHNPAAKADPHLARRFSAAYTPLLNSINEAVA